MPLAPQREGMLQLLLGHAGPADTEDHSSRHLLHLLKSPHQPSNDATTVVVPQGRRGSGDLCDKDTRPNLSNYDTEEGHLEKPPVGGEGLLPGAGLNPERESASYDTANLFGTMGPTTLQSSTQDDTVTIEVPSSPPSTFKRIFPPSPPGSLSNANQGPWWRELLASPVKRLSSDWGKLSEL